VKYPPARWLPVPSFGTRLVDLRGMVLHVQVGYGSLHSYFGNPANQVSSHFWVSETGQVEQYVDTSDMSWAQAAGNDAYLSVETEGLPADPLTGYQVTALSALFSWVARTLSVPLQTCDHGGHGFTTHAHFPSGVADPAWGDHPCPGAARAAQLPELVHLAGGVPIPRMPWPGRYLEYPPLMSGGDVLACQGAIVVSQREAVVKPAQYLLIDGEYGPLTRAAVVWFQQLMGLQVDGIVGPLTWFSLFE
jgi:hypothetical protein